MLPSVPLVRLVQAQLGSQWRIDPNRPYAPSRGTHLAELIPGGRVSSGSRAHHSNLQKHGRCLREPSRPHAAATGASWPVAEPEAETKRLGRSLSTPC